MTSIKDARLFIHNVRDKLGRLDTGLLKDPDTKICVDTIIKRVNALENFINQNTKSDDEDLSIEVQNAFLDNFNYTFNRVNIWLSTLDKLQNDIFVLK